MCHWVRTRTRGTGVSRRDKNEVDVEVDLHGLTVEEMHHALQKRWSGWRERRSVRVIHGQGEALRPAVERWCREMGIPFKLDAGNSGSTLLFPLQRIVPAANSSTLGVTLREKGLQLTPEQEAYLRNPEIVERARQEELRRKKEAEHKRLDELRKTAEQRRRDDALWQAEVRRLDGIDRKGGRKGDPDAKPAAPVVLPPTEIKHQEGFWRAELVRVADTDTDTLKKQKRTGLDKLAPPLEAVTKTEAAKPDARKPMAPQRDTAADQALFEEEMARLMEGD